MLTTAVLAGAASAALLGNGGAVAAGVCPCSLFSSATPTIVHLPAADGRTGDDLTYELGIRIGVSEPVRLTGIRFYKDDLETGTHIGRLWNASGTQLTEAPFDDETASGWQTAPLPTPIDLVPGETYTVSVNANAYFVDQYDALADEVTSGTVFSIGDGNNGVYAGAAGEYPTSSYRTSNYFVDVVVENAAAGTTTDTTTTQATTTDSTTTDTTTTQPTTTDSTTTDTTTTQPTTTGTTSTSPLPPAAETTTADVPAPATSSTKPGSQQDPPATTPGARSVSQTAGTFTAAVTVRVPRSLLPAGSLVPRWPVRVWFALAAQPAAPARLQFAEDTERPWAWRPYTGDITIRTRQHAIWIRFADTLGAVSTWTKVTIP